MSKLNNKVYNSGLPCSRIYLALEPVLTSCNRIPVTAPRTGNGSTESKPITHSDIMNTKTALFTTNYKRKFINCRVQSWFKMPSMPLLINCIQVNPDQSVLPSFLSPPVLEQYLRETQRFLHTEFSSCHPINSIRAVNKTITQSHDFSNNRQTFKILGYIQ